MYEDQCHDSSSGSHLLLSLIQWDLIRADRKGDYMPGSDSDISSPPGESVLIVEDESSLATIIAGYFTKEGFTVKVTGNGLHAVQMARAMPVSVIVLDLGLPGIDGIEACRRIRTFSDAYILMLTARVEEVDELIGLSVGADDYLTKPFSPRVLVARVKALLRRTRSATETTQAGNDLPITVGKITIDPRSRTTILGSHQIPLTKIEFDLLCHLASQPGRVFTREQLVQAVWGGPLVGDDQLVDVHVGHLRKKLKEGNDSVEEIIQTVRGVGYAMKG
ncbi:response regulator transcription factor [Bifidobacterium psychraerophilum]|nr:response regulator transcription factor [Bifidobacterium psychraerophilum]